MVRLDKSAEEAVRVTASEKVREAAREQVFQEAEEEQRGARSGRKRRAAGYIASDANPSQAFGAASGGFAIKNGGRYGIHDKGDYLSLGGKGRKGPDGEREISDAQLRMMLMTAVIAKGWTDELAFYKGNRIDGQLTMRAKSMLSSDPGLHAAFKAAGVTQIPQLQTELVKEAPPWLSSRFAQRRHEARFNKQERKNAADTEKALKAAEKLSRNFNGDVDLGAGVKEQRHERFGQTPVERVRQAFHI